MTYARRLQQRIDATGSGLCVGLDPRSDRHRSVEAVEAFCARVVDETAELAAAFKPNIAYFEGFGVAGYRLLERLVGRVRETGAPVILDAKRGDIGSTQKQYARAYFDHWGVDAVTLSPYMGYDSVEPFLAYPGKGVYLLGVTSNEGAADLETRELADGRRVFELVGDMAARAEEGAAGLVLGLTNTSPDVLERLPDVPLLIPGLGAQGGDLEALRERRGTAPAVVNVSRGILYPDDDRSFSETATDYANRIADVIR